MGARILDAGCGEGVLVEAFRAKGFKIEGLDLNYESEYVRLGSVLEMPYEDGAFDAVLLLDVFEHLAYVDQPVGLAEIRRVLQTGGKLIASIPNLAHWNSRFRLALFGQLDRTDIETNHIGERPFAENRRLLQEAGFRIEEIKGVTLTVPVLYRRVICRRPARFRWLHDLLEPLAVPSLAMLSVFICCKT
jgi:2-polyprenyl-3-methyl-5-hydroxy-6-metoxy-1,4-benzoquinol methylase